MLRLARTVAARVPRVRGMHDRTPWGTTVSACEAQWTDLAVLEVANTLQRTPAASPPRTELLDIWIACEGKMLLTCIHDDDYDFLAHAWDDVYQLSERIGPFASSRYGLLVDVVDDRRS